MTRIQRSTDCGNSPKNQLLQDLTVAIARADAARMAQIVTGDVRWFPVGRKAMRGSKSVCRALTRYGPATALKIDHVISHGNSGAVNGVVTFGEKARGFCYVYEFGSAKGRDVSGITSYSIALG